MSRATLPYLTVLASALLLPAAAMAPGCADGESSQIPGTPGGSTASGGSSHQGGGGGTTPTTSSTTSTTSSGTGGIGGQPPDDPCGGASDGTHCGAELGGLADHSSLYHCTSGATDSVTPCNLGCAGTACQEPPADPCSNANAGNGPYCGASLGAGDSDTLYQCMNGATQSSQVCADGCHVQPPGVPDNCNASGDPCVNADGGNGPYCGASLGSGDPNTLYQCVNLATQSSQVCPNGCHLAPSGQADYCEASAGGCCLNEPPGWITQVFTACGGGGSHYGIDYATATGTPIYAGMAGTVVGHALGFPNCWDDGCTSACWNAYNYVKLRADCGDPTDGSRDFHIYYLHIDGLAAGIADGIHVDQGQLLAYAGNSGCSTGSHIHLETASVPEGTTAYLNTCSSVDPSTRYCP